MDVVLVGLGRMGRNHLRVLKETPGFNLRAIVDVVATAAPADAGVPLLRSLDDLAGVSFDAAVVATPTATHVDVAERLIGMGKHLLVEKPLASTFADASRLIELAQQKGTKLVVGHVERFNPAARKLREVIREGWLGTPVHSSFTRVGGYPETLIQGNNVLLDLAVHDIDVFRSLVGPVRLEAALCHSAWRPDVFDTAEIFLAGSSGPSASIHVNWVTPTKIRSIRVTGTRGVCFVDYILQTCDLLGGSLLRTAEPASSSFDSIADHYRTSDKISFGVAKEEPLRAQAAQLLRFLEKGESGELASGKDALAAVLVAERAVAKGVKRGRERPEGESGPLPRPGDDWI